MKTIAVTDNTWKKVTQLKLDLGHRTMDETVNYMHMELEIDAEGSGNALVKAIDEIEKLEEELKENFTNANDVDGKMSVLLSEVRRDIEKIFHGEKNEG